MGSCVARSGASAAARRCIVGGPGSAGDPRLGHRPSRRSRTVALNAAAKAKAPISNSSSSVCVLDRGRRRKAKTSAVRRKAVTPTQQAAAISNGLPTVNAAARHTPVAATAPMIRLIVLEYSESTKVLRTLTSTTLLGFKPLIKFRKPRMSFFPLVPQER